jgi:hypothetical protein
MNDESKTVTAEADPEDHWPEFSLSPAEYKKAVADIVNAMDLELTDWQVQHLERVEGLDGTYAIDVTARFRLKGMDFLVLFECKRHSTPVKREHVQVLHSKLQSTGAQKGAVVAASGFQSGALEYAKAHGIACIRLVDDAWTYVTRHTSTTQPPAPTGAYSGYALTPDGEDDYEFALLNGSTSNTRAALIDDAD